MLYIFLMMYSLVGIAVTVAMLIADDDVDEDGIVFKAIYAAFIFTWWPVFTVKNLIDTLIL